MFQNKEQSARKRLESLKTRSKPFQGKHIISEEGANRLEETREFRERVENFRRGSKPLERELRISRETRIFESKEQTAGKELETRVSEEAADRWKQTRESENKEQTARKEMENFRRRGNPLERVENFDRD